jgi:hypothetical protein
MSGYKTTITPQYPPAGTSATAVTIATMIGNPGPPGPSVDHADQIAIEDAGGYYDGTDIEAALQEAGEERTDSRLRNRLGV